MDEGAAAEAGSSRPHHVPEQRPVWSRREKETGGGFRSTGFVQKIQYDDLNCHGVERESKQFVAS